MREQRTLNPLASALTRFAPASPLDSALTKNILGGGGAPCDRLLSTLAPDFQLFSVNSFRFTHFPKNAPATPLVSHTFKTKDLKPFRFTHFQKKVGGTPIFRRSRLLYASAIPRKGVFSIQHPTPNLQPPLFQSPTARRRPTFHFLPSTVDFRLPSCHSPPP